MIVELFINSVLYRMIKYSHILKVLGVIIIFSFGQLEIQAEETPTILLICDQSHVAAWQKFADWKKQSGRPTHIRSVQSLGVEFKGADIQAQIQAAVAAYVEKESCKWVVLGGDAVPNGGLVPDRDSVHLLYGQKMYLDIPSDCYYVSNRSWDANGDAVYGLWMHDKEKISYTGQASIGRIPVRSIEDIQNYTDKVIAYESHYPTTAYAEKFLYTCAVPFADYKYDMYWNQHLKPHWQGSCDLYMCGKTAWDVLVPGDYDISAKNFIERINKQSHGKMHQHGHGLLDVWVLDVWVLENDQVLDAAGVRQLHNKNAYPIITTVSCFTGNFDGAKDPCISESMLRAKDSGAIAIIAPAREGVPIFPDWARDPKDGTTQDGTTRLLTHFWEFGLSQHISIGEAFALAKKEMTADAQRHPGYHWCCSEINLLGDPSLDMRALAPVEYEMGSNVTSVRAGKKQTLVCTLSAPLRGMKVCLWNAADVYKIAHVDEKGMVIFEVPPMPAGKLTLTAYGPNQNTKVLILSIE